MAESRPRQPRKSPSTGRASATRPDHLLTRGMTCETALQTISRGCIEDIKHHGRAAARGDAEALHRIRIALTRLRTAIRFFAPAVDDDTWKALQRQAAWLSRQSGVARDIDVALQRQRRKGVPAMEAGPWRKQRDQLYERLASALHSARYRRFIDALSRRSGPAIEGTPAACQRNTSADKFSARRLARWKGRLLAKGRRLDRLGARKLHRLRMRAKRFRYALEWSLPLLEQERSALREQVAQAKRVQNALGRLNDATMHQAHAEALKIDPLPSMVRLSRGKSQHRLLASASRALEELERLKL